MKRTELAWAAGFFDGEGCTTKSTDGYPLVLVAQKDPRPLHRFHAAVAGFGKITLVKHQHGDYWQWRCSTWQDTRKVLALLWPYLSEPKREQANAAWGTFDEMRRLNPYVGQGRGRRSPKSTTARALRIERGLA